VLDIVLNGNQQRELNDALLSAFPSEGELARMVRFGLNRNLAELAPGGDLRQIVFALVQRLEAENGIHTLLIAALQENSRNLALRAFASGIGVDLKAANIRPIHIPFVVAAMNYDQAVDLINTPAGRQVPFQRFSRALPQQKRALVDLLPCYSPQRDDWKPPGYQQHTILEVVAGVIARLKQLGYISDLTQPQFLSEELFSSDPQIRNSTGALLSEAVSVLLVDAVSLFHPEIMQRLLETGLAANRNVALFVHSPLGAGTLPANQLIETEIIRRTLWIAFTRFTDEMDRYCEFRWLDSAAMQRWLFAILPEIARTAGGLVVSQENRQRFRAQTNYQSRGIASQIFGAGGGT